MDKVTRYEWHGSWSVLVLLFILGITIPVAVVYFMINLVRIETQVVDAGKQDLDAEKEKLTEFLREARKEEV